MPKYTFKCSTCNREQRTTVSVNIKKIHCSQCRGDMLRKMPTINGQSVTETIDKHTNTRWIEDQPQILRDRRDEYYWTVEVPRFVNSGIYSIQTMLENQWISINEKGEVVVNNKPPRKH